MDINANKNPRMTIEYASWIVLEDFEGDMLSIIGDAPSLVEAKKISDAFIEAELEKMATNESYGFIDIYGPDITAEKLKKIGYGYKGEWFEINSMNKGAVCRQAVLEEDEIEKNSSHDMLIIPHLIEIQL